jgi:hypothetical protein
MKIRKMEPRESHEIPTNLGRSDAGQHSLRDTRRLAGARGCQRGGRGGHVLAG